MRTAGATELLTSYTTGEGEPWPFYERLGFLPTGELDAVGEVILSLDLFARLTSARSEPIDRRPRRRTCADPTAG